jgi:hypothetical protein
MSRPGSPAATHEARIVPTILVCRELQRRDRARSLLCLRTVLVSLLRLGGRATGLPRPNPRPLLLILPDPNDRLGRDVQPPPPRVGGGRGSRALAPRLART